MGGDDQVLQSALHRLFGAPLDEFTATRDTLAKQLRGEGHAAAAKSVASLRKPVVPAWAVNQLARRFAGEVRELLAAGRRLRDIQLAGLSGQGAQGLQEAVQDERQLVSSLTEYAGRLLAEAGHPASPAHLEAIRMTLSAAASLPEEQRALIEQGRLERPLTPAGFGDLLAGALTLPAPSARVSRAVTSRRHEARAPSQPPKPDRAEELRQRVLRRREREARVSRFRDAHTTAAKAAKLAAARVRSLQNLVETLRKQIDQATRELDSAHAESRRTAVDVEDAARRLAEAQSELDSEGRLVPPAP